MATRGDALEVKKAILMARFLDTRGVPLQPAMIDAIRFSIYRRNPRGRPAQAIVACHERVALNVFDVFSNSLRRDSLWLIDDVGYNFCHRIAWRDCEKARRESQQRYDVEYVITQMTGETTVVCFRLGGV